MIFDIENTRAGYVTAAYGVAAAALVGLLLVSWREARRRQAEWKRLQNERAASKGAL